MHGFQWFRVAEVDASGPVYPFWILEFIQTCDGVRARVASQHFRTREEAEYFITQQELAHART